MNKNYRLEIYTDYNDQGDLEYIARYYDLETVIGVGATIEEAIDEAKANLEVFLDYCQEKGIEVPKASIHEKNDFSGKVTLRMTKHLHKLVDDRARLEGVSINALLNDAISSYIYSNDKELNVNNDCNISLICK